MSGRSPFDRCPQAFGDHQALLDSEQIDAVYIPLPTGLRKPWVLAAAKAKKHVLIEKPVADTAEDAEEMAAACSENGVQLMDGVMFDHSKRIAEVRRAVNEGHLGTIRRIQAHFSFAGDQAFQSGNIRTDPVLECHGCLGDLGWYCIRLILWAMDFRAPTTVSGRTIERISRQGSGSWVPAEFAGELGYQDGPSAGFFCSFMSSNQQTATISGDAGYISLDDYVLPLYDSQTTYQVHRHELEIDNCRWNFRRRTESRRCDEYHSGESNAQEVQMLRRFAQQVIAGKIDSELTDRALLTQRIFGRMPSQRCRRWSPVPFADS